MLVAELFSLRVTKGRSGEVEGCHSAHLHAKSGADSLVNIVGNAHSRGHLAEVWYEASVQAPPALCAEDVSEEAECVSLVCREGEFGAEARLALQLGPDQGQGVGRQLATAGTGHGTCH